MENSEKINFDLAISFAGKDRKLARSITRELSPRRFQIYLDEYYVENTWGRDLSEEFQKTYGTTKCLLIIVSQEYLQKDWTKMERRFIIDNMMKNPETRVLQLKLDNVDLPGIPSVIGYLMYDGDLNKLCANLINILGERELPNFTEKQNSVTPIFKACFRRAIFTSMNSEISTKAMFDSLRQCIAQLNGQLVYIHDGKLSQYVKSIISDLDNLDRFSMGRETYCLQFDDLTKSTMNSFKLSIIDKLHFLNYKYETGVDLPNDIGFDYQFRSYKFIDERIIW